MDKIKLLSVLLFMFMFQGISQHKNLVVEGIITDKTKMTVPYASVSIAGKTVGTSSTEEGTFLLSIPNSYLEEILIISSLGFETYKIKISDFLNKKNKEIVLKESIVSLATVELFDTKDYVKSALKKLKENTVSSKHQLNVLYRRSSVEDGKSRFFVEHYINLLDYGPLAEKYSKVQVQEGRKSADYRFIKKKQPIHAIHIMARSNPLRSGISLKEYNWKKTGDTSYDDEDIVIVEGRKKKYQKNFIRLFIGTDTYSIYKIETSNLDAVYVYKKNKDGKMYLSYHNREWISKAQVPEHLKRIMGNNIPKHILVSYRHEAFVLGLQTQKEKIRIKKDLGYGTDMGDLNVDYHSEFWKNISLPPETKFFKKIKKELESNFGVPLEQQFKLANKLN